MPERILAGRVDLVGMMRALQGGDAEAATGQLRDEALKERCLAGAAPAGEPDDPHHSASAAGRKPSTRRRAWMAGSSSAARKAATPGRSRRADTSAKS